MDDIVTNPVPEDTTVLRVSNEPGLGVDVDEDKLAKYSVHF